MIRRAARRGLAAACALVLTSAGLQVVATSAAAAAEPREIAVVRPDQPVTFLADRIQMAGATGFLHKYSLDGPPMWTRYSDGVTTALPDLQSIALDAWAPGGGDTVWTRSQVPGHSVAGSATGFDIGRMTWRTFEAPSTGLYNLYGDTMLVYSQTTADGWSLRRFAPDGSYTPVPVTEMPEDATSAAVLRGDSDELVLRFSGSSGPGYGLLDLRTGVVSLLPAEIVSVQAVLLSADHVAFRSCPGASDPCPVRIYSRAELRTGGATARTVMVPRTLHPTRTLLVGTHLIGAANGNVSTADRPPAIDYSVVGTPAIAPMTYPGTQMFAQGATGGLFVGGAAGDWAVRRLTATGNGGLAQQVVLDLKGKQATAGLTLSQGLLRHIQGQRLGGGGTASYQLLNYLITSSGGTSAPAGGELIEPKVCQAEVACVRTVDSHPSGTAYVDRSDKLRLRDVATANTDFVTLLAGSTLVDASPRYLIANATDGPSQQIIAVPQPVRTRPVAAAALWFDTLWTSPSTGTLRATDLRDDAVLSTVSTGSTCVPDEMQAALRYIYWSCGASAPAGVFDTTRRTTVNLPAGRYLLGDGYVVRHDSATGRLLRYDLTGGTLGEPAVVATLPAGPVTDSRNISWAVDKYSGNIAYSDAASAVHIVDPGVTRSAPAVNGRYYDGNGPWVTYTDGGAVSPRWPLTRPVDSWVLTITRISTGAVVNTQTGGAARKEIRASWDGRLATGQKVPSGRYRYRLDATVDGTTTQIDSDVVGVRCGTPLYRSYSCDGTAMVLGVFTSGEGHWLSVANGSVTDHGNTDHWRLGTDVWSVSAIVPFGDLDGDGNNDLLVRKGTGELTLHYGTGEPSFPGQGPLRVVGTGWGGMKQILSSGDLTGDGLPDVLAQTSANVLRRYHGTSAGGLANGTVVPGTWTQPKLIGPGDVNGDGKADLYAITSAGQLDVFFGTGTGTFGAAQRVGTGWSSYTVIGAGDANEDNRHDLVARDGRRHILAVSRHRDRDAGRPKAAGGRLPEIHRPVLSRRPTQMVRASRILRASSSSWNRPAARLSMQVGQRPTCPG